MTLETYQTGKHIGLLVSAVAILITLTLVLPAFGLLIYDTLLESSSIITIQSNMLQLVIAASLFAIYATIFISVVIFINTYEKEITAYIRSS